MVVENTSKCYIFGEITYQVYPNGDIKGATGNLLKHRKN